MAEWRIRVKQAACEGCSAVFEEGARHVSMLAVRGDDLLREDLCVSCFEARQPGDEIFWWLTRQQAGRRGPTLDLAMVERLFLRLEGRQEEKLLELRYLLCLILMRKKRLKLARVERDGREVMIVRRPRRDEALRVEVFDFTPERMSELRAELTAAFDGAEPEPDAEDPASGLEAAEALPG